MAEDHSHHNAPADGGFDRHEVNAKLIAGLVLSTVVALAAVIAAIQYYYDRNYEQQVYVKVLEPVASDLQNLRAREDQELHSYQYIDRDKGLVRLPVDRAMELLEEEYETGRLKYPTQPYPVRTEDEQTAAEQVAKAQ